jgi:hypothetical protein
MDTAKIARPDSGYVISGDPEKAEMERAYFPALRLFTFRLEASAASDLHGRVVVPDLFVAQGLGRIEDVVSAVDIAARRQHGDGRLCAVSGGAHESSLYLIVVRENGIVVCAQRKETAKRFRAHRRL